MAEMWPAAKLREAKEQLERGEIAPSRELLHQALMSIAHPLSPFDDFDCVWADRMSWYALAEWSWVDILLDLAENPPLEDKYCATFEDCWDSELSALILKAGEQEPAACVERFLPLLTSPEGRAVALSVIGTLGTPEEKERYLSPFLASFYLSNREVETLGFALLDSASAEAQARFEAMRSFLTRDWSDVVQELDRYAADHNAWKKSASRES